MRHFILVLVVIGCVAATRQVRQANTHTVSRQCDFRNPDDRIDCGYYGIDVTRCEARGCCFDSYSGSHHNCFYGSLHEEGLKVSGQYGNKTHPCSCEGIEDNSKHGPGKRGFIVNCQKPNKKDTPRCRYEGNPHKCGPKYNNRGQKKFYEHLLDIIGPDMCLQDALQMHCVDRTYTTKMCPDVPFQYVGDEKKKTTVRHF